MSKTMTKFQLWIGGWICIATGIIRVVSFGFYGKDWEMTWCVYCTKKNMEAAQIKHKRETERVQEEIQAVKSDPYGHIGKGGVWVPQLGPCVCEVCVYERQGYSTKLGKDEDNE